MKAMVMRCAAFGLVILLIFAYFFLPWEQENTGMSGSSTRGKQEIHSGDQLSWRWTPGEGDVTELAMRLSGLKNAQELTLTVELADLAGKQVSSLTQKAADLGDSEELVLKGRFIKGTEYILTIGASGEGNVKLRGEETESGFYPQLIWRGSMSTRNPTLLYFALGCLLIMLVPLRNEKPRKLGKMGLRENLASWGTLVIILVSGLLIVLLKPSFTEGYDWQLWDEEIHWTGVQSLLPNESNNLPKALGHISNWTPGYLPLILGAGLTSLFTSQAEMIYRVGTVFSVLVYGALAMLAVRHAPRYKASFMVAAVLPAHLFLSSGMTYDTAVIGSILLGTALLLEVLDQAEEMSAAQGITLLSVLAFGTVAKPAYSAALLMPLLIPSKKLGSSGKAWLFRLLTVLILIWCVSAVALPGAYDPVRSGDSRYEGTDAAAQIAFLNSRPLEWILFPLRNLVENAGFLLVEGIPHWAYLGTNLTLGYVFVGLLLLAAPLAVCGEAGEKTAMLRPGRRLLLGGTALICECALILTQYLVSSPVGGSLRGMQARYILPVWILLALSLMLPERLRGAFRKAGPWLAAVLWLGCLGLDVWYALSWLQSTGCI